jgi:hypothetical protein
LIGCEQMSRLGKRPVAEHILAVLEQSKGVGYHIADLVREMAKQDWHHTGNAIGDNCKLLVEQELIVERDKCYGIAKDGDITIPEPPPKHTSKPKPKRPERDRCDRCGRKFEWGDKFYMRQFSNVSLCLCEDCYVLKVTT